MSRQLIIKIAPNETIHFPALCTSCAKSAAESMELVKRNGGTRRLVDVPVCEQCAAQLHKKSAAEERLQKQSWLFAIITGVVTLFAALLLLPGAIFWLRFLFAIFLAILAAAVVLRLFRTAITDAALPEKKAVLDSAQLQAFSWRTASFEFSNDIFIERFIELNEPLLLEK